GYDRTTVDAIATTAGVSKPTLYRRWPHGKPELIADAIRERHAQTSRTPDTGSLRGDLLALVAIQTGQLLDDIPLPCRLVTALGTSPELAELMQDTVIAEERARFAEVLDRAQITNPSPLVADVAGALIFTRVTITGEPVDHAFAEELVDNVLLPILN